MKMKVKFWLGLAAVAVIGVLVGRRLMQAKRMPNIDIWQKELAKTRGANKAAALAARIQAHYDELCAARAHHAHPALREHLEKNILPGLALYRVLRTEHDDVKAALTETDALLELSMEPAKKLMAGLRHVPNAFGLLRRLVPPIMRSNFPEAGWKIEWVENSSQSVAFNLHSCFCVDTLTACGAPELAPSFCRLDDVISGELAPAISWDRTQTIARGAEYCDFRWSRKANEYGKAD
ncbi:MAG: L-2-amino-thiazoline-4-carboxylic acid hydrolase [Anaerolineae bacterium]|nr:L-2-amino-thiazoline-4-carboxylic acid hydrolase [Anaerolineae bacterium]